MPAYLFGNLFCSMIKFSNADGFRKFPGFECVAHAQSAQRLVTFSPSRSLSDVDHKHETQKSYCLFVSALPLHFLVT